MSLIASLCFLIGSASPGSRPSYRAAEWGARAASVYREQRGGEDPGRCQIQTERGPEGHPGRHVRPEILQPWAQGFPAGHPGARRAGWGTDTHLSWAISMSCRQAPFSVADVYSPLFSLFSQEEDEVPDDETVNQMIARSEEEFDHFMVRSATCFPLTFVNLTLFVLFFSTLLFQFFLISFRPAHGSWPPSWRGS